MTLPKPTIVIFDMDGTSVRHINPRLLGVLEWLDDLAFSCSKLVYRLMGKDKTQLPKKKRRAPRLLVHRAIHHLRRKEVDQIVEPCPGIYQVLNFLRDHRIPLAVASNGLGKGYGHDVLKTFHLDTYFSASVFREDIRHAKPNPEGLLLTIQRMNIKLSADDMIWYIGDRHKDVTAALAAAKHLPCKIIPIAYGLNAAVAILDKGLSPEQIVMSYPDMLERLKTLLGKPVAQPKTEVSFTGEAPHKAAAV